MGLNLINHNGRQFYLPNVYRRRDSRVIRS
jgi:hypothetical protein